MAQYYKTCPSVVVNLQAPEQNDDPPSTGVHILSEFDKHRMTLLSNDAEEGWASELRRYLSTMQWDVKKDTDIIDWWQVSRFACSHCNLLKRSYIGPRSTLPNTRAHCAGCPSVTGFIGVL
jgi:hypothetical protein